MKVTKDQLIAYANTLYNEADNPEYLRGMVELIAYAVQESEDFEQTVEEVESAILSNAFTISTTAPKKAMKRAAYEL